MKVKEIEGLGKQSYKNLKENLDVLEQFAEFCNIPNKKKIKSTLIFQYDAHCILCLNSAAI